MTIAYIFLSSFSDVPKLVASKITMANLGDTVTLECMVDAHPEPKMMFWRDAQGRTPVIQSGKHDVNVIRSKEDYTKYVMELTISKLTETDDGDYYCHAENSFGSSTKPVSVRIRNSVSLIRAIRGVPDLFTNFDIYAKNKKIFFFF